MRHSGAGKPRLRRGKQVVAKGKANNSASNGSYRGRIEVLRIHGIRLTKGLKKEPLQGGGGGYMFP